MAAAENCVCFNLRRVTRVVTQFYDSEMRRLGIRPTQGTILASLNAKDSWNMAELSEWLGMERTTLVRNLQPLQRDGLVQKTVVGHSFRSPSRRVGAKQIGKKLEPPEKQIKKHVVYVHSILENKTALVTGVSSGIGREVGQLLAERGATMFGTVRDPKLASSIRGVELVRMDVTDDASVSAAVQSLGGSGAGTKAEQPDRDNFLTGMLVELAMV
jgi:DNA-binding MarR family transcriptional regulator